MAQSNETEVKLSVNGKEAEQELSRLRDRAKELKQSLEDALRAGNKEAAQHFKKELRNVDSELRKCENGVKAVERTMRQLNKATPQDLNKALRFLQNELKSIERGTPAWDAHVKKIKMVKAELEKVNSEMKVSKTLFERMKDSINNWGASFMAGVGAISGLVMAGKKAVNTYAEMQQEEANVRKYTGMTAEEVEHLNEAFKKMDTRTGRDELNKLAQEAGRLGLQSEEDVLGFVKAADKINVALDDLGEGATLTLSKLTDIFGDKQRLGVEQSLLAVGSVINELSQNSTASAPYLAEFAQRLAGVGAQAQMSIPEIMGFGAVLDSQGQKLEMSATALSKVIMNLFKDPAKIASATGLAVEEFSETCKRSTNEGLLMLLDRLHELGGIDSLAPVFKDMGENGARASAVLAALAGNVDMVRQQQEAANDAFREATSIDKEFEVQNTTVQAGLEKARKGFTEMAVTLGKELMPIVSKLISGTSMTMRVMLKVIQFVKEYRAALIGVTTTLVAYYAIVKAQDAWNAFTGGIKKAISAVKSFNAALLANPYAAIAAALIGIGTALAIVIKRRNEATLLEKTEAEAQKEISKQYQEQKSKIDMLNDAVHDETLSMKARQKALEELKGLVPEYHASLTNEGKLINDNADAIDNYTKKLEKQIQMQVYQEKLMELYQKKMQAEENVTNRQADLDKANQEADAHAGEVQMRTSMGAAGPTGGFENSYSVNVRVKTENLEGAKKELTEVEQAIDKIKGKIKDGDLLAATSGGNSTQSSGTATVQTGGGEDELKERLKKLDEMRAQMQAQDKIAYLSGEKNFKEYTEANIETDIAYYGARMKLLDENSTEYLQAKAAKMEAEKKLQQEHNGQSVKDEQQRYADEKAAADQRYADGKISAKAYQLELEQMELTHLQNLVNIYDEGSEERLKAQEKYNQTSLKYQQKHAQEAKKMQESLQKQFFSNVSGVTDSEGYEEKKLQLAALREVMLAQATAEQKIQIEEAYQKARYELAKEYHDEEGMYALNAAQARTDEILAYMKTDAFQGVYQAFSTLVDGMGQIFSNLSSLMDAEVDLQTAKINKKYEAEIAAAGNNKDAVARLEEEKEKEIAKVKNEAEEKKYGMQIASTIAQTAISAVNAYSSAAAIPVVGWIMGPIAAAMAVAAGGIQLATLKKQHEAAMAQGYAAGGYTMPGSKYQPAGIVHAGEWVASQELLANPTAAATIAQLDQAQRTNTIGQLSKPAPVVSSANDRSSGGIMTGDNGYQTPGVNVGESIDRLNKTLDGGIYAATLMTGDKGIVRQQKRYNQLMKNKGK